MDPRQYHPPISVSKRWRKGRDESAQFYPRLPVKPGPPARYVAEARLAAARQLLEQTSDTLERVAEQSGLGSAINLRRIFEKQRT